jgi:predicted P-loop ATPase/GTPase
LLKTVMIAGLHVFDSGKTWFTLGLASHVRSLGLRVRVYKPVAGHSLWYSPRTFRKSLKIGLLVGNDASIYYDNKLMENPLLGNPIAIATAPPDPVIYGEDIERYLADSDSVYTSVVISRITDCSAEVARHYLYISNLNKSSPALRRLVKKLAEALRAEEGSVSELSSYMESAESESNIEACLNKIAVGGELVFIESFNDAVSPCISLLKHLDALVIVAPGRAFVYLNGDDVRQTVLRLIEEKGWEGLRSKYVVSSLKPQIALNISLTPRPQITKAHKKLIDILLGT